jgi:hypothetical protein
MRCHSLSSLSMNLRWRRQKETGSTNKGTSSLTVYTEVTGSAREVRPICSRMAADCRRAQARSRDNASKQIWIRKSMRT